MSTNSVECKYCKHFDKIKTLDMYECQRCKKYAHYKCMKIMKPSTLQGDYLFEYDCRECSFTKEDTLMRAKLNWVQIIHLVLYNLSVTETGRRGYFRWKEEICTFIDHHWNMIMPERIKTPTWSNTIAGILSIHSKKTFKSGQVLFNETGWWALQKVIPPNLNDVDEYKQSRTYAYTGNTNDMLVKQAEQLKEYGRGKRQRKDIVKDSVVTKKSSKAAKIKRRNSNENPPLPKVEIKLEPEEPNNVPNNENNIYKNNSVVSENIFDPSQMKIKEEPFEFNMDPCMESELAFQENGIDDLLSNTHLPFDPVSEILSSHILNEPDTFTAHPLMSEPMIAESSITQPIANNYTGIETTNKDESACLDSGTISAVAPRNAKSKVKEKEMVPLNSQEENEFLLQINSCTNTLESDPSARRLRRKLKVRKLKREIGLDVFNLDSVVTDLVRKSLPDSMKFLVHNVNTGLEGEKKKCVNVEASTDRKYIYHPALRGVNVLDRFVNYNYSNMNRQRQENKSFMQLIGLTESRSDVRSIISPYTSRVLKPYIRRDFNTFPCKLKLLKDIRKRFGYDDEHYQWPIDYCYVQPNHIPSVNSLCSDFFWPGIDLTECLQYPEFSCVVLYRKLLIGFAFMVPDVNYNEAYISFIFVHPDWQRAGIATYMIYHLIQTCMGKDITLHVSPSNSSMILYQKFGFKVEELNLDFYEKYITSDQPGSRHAFFLRLQR